MEVIRTAQAVPKAELVTTTAELLKNSFTWHKTETAEDGLNLYLSDTIYFQLETTNYCLNLVDTANNYNSKIWDFDNSYHNLTIYKVNDKCGGLTTLQSGDANNLSYNKTITIAFDTTNDGDGASVIVPETGGTSLIVDGVDSLTIKSPTPYHNSYNVNYICSQIAPLTNAKTGVKFDNIHGILYSDIAMETRVSLNNKEYYFSAGLALPCGDEVTYTTAT